MCGEMFGGLGVDVIKVEPPGGEPARAPGPFYHDERHPHRSLHRFALNTSKHGITLDLESADGRALVKDLVRTAHVISESFPPGYLAGLGLGYDDLARVNPAIIVTSITGFGQNGPYAHPSRGHDRHRAARSG